MKPDAWPQREPRFPEASELGLSKNLLKRSVLFEVGIGQNKKLWLARMMLLFQMPERICDKDKKFIFVLNMNVLPRHSEADKALKHKVCGKAQTMTPTIH